jgi:hypothetical protein
MRWARRTSEFTLKERVLAVFAIIALLLGLSVLIAPPAEAGSPSNMCLHSAQALHEISAPASWPGTRAAHKVSWYTNIVSWTVYTKSGWWDLTWDYYYANSKAC